MAAPKRITQETFDAAVKENIEEFCMDPEEAVVDAVKQFESQGVNLANIVKEFHIGGDDAAGEEDTHPVVNHLKEIETATASFHGDLTDDDKQRLLDSLDRFAAECDIDLARRCLAGTNSAYPTLFSLCQKVVESDQSDPSILVKSLTALASFLNGQPDFIDTHGMELLCCVVRRGRSSAAEVLQVTVKTIYYTCVMHENNRQKYVTAHKLIELLVPLLDTCRDSPALVKEICAALRVLTLDDDIRAPYGKAHDHAKAIVEAGVLNTLLGILQNSLEDETLVSETCVTLSRLAVRNEFCQEIVELGGLKLLHKILLTQSENQRLVKQVFVVLKVIAGNDEVKVDIVNAGGVPLIIGAINKHQARPQVCENGCGTLATLALRKPDHCRVMMEAGVAPTIATVMKVHPTSLGVQQQACMLIRNLVARTREYCAPILELGIELLIQQACSQHGKQLEDYAKSALRDLGCKVELKELWKGEKIAVTE